MAVAPFSDHERALALHEACQRHRDQAIAGAARRFHGVPVSEVEDAFDDAAETLLVKYRGDPSDSRAVGSFMVQTHHNLLRDYLRKHANHSRVVDWSAVDNVADHSDPVAQRHDGRAVLEALQHTDEQVRNYMLLEAAGTKRAQLIADGWTDRQIRRCRTAASEIRLELARKLAGLWPFPVLRRLFNSPATSDAVAVGSQLATSGAGRIGGQLAGCVAAGIAAIVVCAATGIVPLPARDPGPEAATPQASPTPVATVSTPVPTRTPDPIVTATPTPRPKQQARRRAASAKQSGAGTTQGGTGASSHEEAPASDVPANSAPDGSSEFGPSDATGVAPPAPVPAGDGAAEFGP